jgi:hypothetical protein
MEQSPSWEANWSSATQEIPRILWNPKVHHRIHNSPPPVPILSLGCTEGSAQFRGPCVWFVTCFKFLRWGVFSTTPNLEDHPLSAVRDCEATLRIRRPFFHWQLEDDAPCHDDKDPLITAVDVLHHLFYPLHCSFTTNAFDLLYLCSWIVH